MNYALNERHKKTTFDKRQIDMIIDVINTDLKVRDTFITIARSSRSKSNPNAPGITQTELISNDKLSISRHMCEKYLHLLIGTTTIYYNETGGNGREKYYNITTRGADVLAEIIRRNKESK